MQLLGRLLRSMFPQSHNQLFYNFVSIVAGLLDGSMLFEAPASIVDVLSLCKADLVPTVTALNDASLVTSGIYSNVLNDDAEHMIVAKLLKETCKGMFIDMELNFACMGISEHSWYLVIL